MTERPKPTASSSKLPLFGPLSAPRSAEAPEKEALDELLQHLLRALEASEADLAKLPQPELKASESILDWGLNLVKGLGPKLLKLAPGLLSLL